MRCLIVRHDDVITHVSRDVTDDDVNDVTSRNSHAEISHATLFVYNAIVNLDAIATDG